MRNKKMKKITLALMAIAGLAGATTAFASDNGWYVFGAVGQSTNNDKSPLDNALTSAGASGFSSSMSTPTLYNLDVGYQFIKYFAVEGGYIGTNNPTYSASGGNLPGPVNVSDSVHGWDVKAVGILPLGYQFSLLGKVGAADMSSSATVTGPGGSASVSGSKTDVTYGLGAEYDFTNAVLVRLDWDNYNIGDSNSSNRVNIWTVGVGYKF